MSRNRPLCGHAWGQVTAASRGGYGQGLANRDLAFRRAEGIMAGEYSEEREHVVATERRAFRDTTQSATRRRRSLRSLNMPRRTLTEP